jgi:hypothetical protein
MVVRHKRSRDTPSKRGKVVQKNTGASYEQVTRAIFNQIVNTDFEGEGVRSIDVKHNATLQGRLSTHQIDVYWKFEVGGVEYQTIVQARDWESKIKQGHILEFKGVLDDIPGQPRGIYVTRSGYQKGALTLAHACGIELFVLRPRPSMNIQVRALGFGKLAIKPVPISDEAPLGLVMEAITYEPEFTNFELRLHADAINERSLRANLGIQSKLSCRLADISLYDLADQPLSSLEDVVHPLLKTLKQDPNFQGKISHDFVDPTHLRLPGHSERVRIAGLSAELHFKETARGASSIDFSDRRELHSGESRKR